jgi:predicted nucleotidyltransferase
MGFSVLDQAIARAQTAREDARQQTRSAVDEALAALAKRYAFGEVYLFGSLVKPGRYRGDSDVDLAVSGLGDAYWTFAAELSEQLGRDVDLVDLDTSRFAERIRREGIRWTR